MSANGQDSHVWTRRLLGGIALVALAALGVVTWHALRIEASEARSKRAAAEQESLRLALWRMDSLMTPILAREAARPYFEYESFYPAGRAYSDVLGTDVSERDVLLASPLLSNEDPIVQMHFQQVGGRVESPQAPTGAKRELAEGVYVSQYAATMKQAKLAELRGLLASSRSENKGAPAVSDRAARNEPSPQKEKGGQYKRVRSSELADAGLRGSGEMSARELRAELDDKQAKQPATSDLGVDGVVTGKPDDATKANEPTTADAAPVDGRDAAAGASFTAESDVAKRQQSGDDVVKVTVANPQKQESALEQVQRADYQARSALTKQAQTKAQIEASNIANRSSKAGGNAGANLGGVMSPSKAADGEDRGDEAAADKSGLATESNAKSVDSSKSEEQRAKDVAGADKKVDVSGSASGAPVVVPGDGIDARRGGAPLKAATASSPATDPLFSSSKSPDGEVLPEKENTASRDTIQHDELLSLPSEMGPESGFAEFGAVERRPMKDGSLQFGPEVTVGEQAEVLLGDFQAAWIARESGKGAEAGPELVFRRTVRVGEKQFQQGFWINWPELQRTLVEPVKDIYPAAALKPVTQSLSAVPSATLGRMLASIPAELVVPAGTDVSVPGWTPLRTALLATWVLVALSLVALALTARAMAELAERRGQFVSAVTHELRTPLTTFRLYSQMLSEGMVQDEQTKRGYAQTLFSESQRLGRIVESVLDYARLGKHGRARPMELQWESRPVGELATQMDATLRGVAEQHGMGLELVGPEHGPDSSLREVRVDITRLERILVNLVENAGKYGKPIDALGEHRAVVRWEANGSRVRISVRDFGAGVSAGEAKNIFRPFTRGEAHAHGSTPGMGLGLSLARGLAEQMGGGLFVQSPRDGGLGAEFVVELVG